MPSGTFYLGVGADDGQWHVGGYNNTDTGIFWGLFGNQYNNFHRFPAVTIPNGAVISSAIIRVQAGSTQSSSTVNVNCYFNNIDDAVAPTTIGEGDALALTSAVAWNSIPAWTNNVDYDSPELATILQAIVDRPGWVSGNALMAVFKSNGSTAYRSSKSYEASTTLSARLIVTWTVPTNINALLPVAPQMSAEVSIIPALDINALLPIVPQMSAEVYTPPRYNVDALLLVDPQMSATVQKGGPGETIALLPVSPQMSAEVYTPPRYDITALLPIAPQMSAEVLVRPEYDITALLPISPLMNAVAATVSHVTALFPVSPLIAATVNATHISGRLLISPSMLGDIYYHEIYYCDFNSPLPTYTIDADGYSTAIAELSQSLPMLSSSAAGYTNDFADSDVSLPLYAIEAEISDGSVASLLAALPMFTLVAEMDTFDFAAASLSIPMLQLTAESLYGGIASLDKSLPFYTLSASALSNITGEANLVIPMLDLQAALLPTSFLNMAMNLRNKALTTYSNYNFNSLCRFNGIHLGATSTGIFDLDQGATDNGILLSWNIRTGYFDLEQNYKKRLKQAWLSYKSTGDIMLTVIQPDGESYEYSLEGVEITDTGLRVKFGKGIRSKYVAIDIKNEAGSSLTLDTLKLQFEKINLLR